MTQSTPGPARVGGCRWLVSEDSAGLFPVRTGIAESEGNAWIAAFAAGRDALLEGRIRYLAIAVEDEIPTFGYSPGRDRHGRLDPDHVARHLEELLRDTLDRDSLVESGSPGDDGCGDESELAGAV